MGLKESVCAKIFEGQILWLNIHNVRHHKRDDGYAHIQQYQRHDTNNLFGVTFQRTPFSFR